LEAAILLDRIQKQPVDLVVDQLRGCKERMCLQRFLALVLLASLIALYPLAFASPPDPVWLTGIYDDADMDDVVWVISSTTALVERLTVERLTVVVATEFLAVGTPHLAEAELLPIRFSSARPVRAPPSC
jgi:hypothetical protein